MNPQVFRTFFFAVKRNLFSKKLKLLYLLAYCLGFVSQLNAQPSPSTPVVAVVGNYGIQVSHGQGGQTRFRTYVFQNTGAVFNDDIDFKYLQLDAGLDVVSLRVVVCSNDPRGFLSTGSPFLTDPLPNLCSGSSPPLIAASVPTSATFSSWSQSFNINIPTNSFVCVIEEVRPQECVPSLVDLNSTIEINFPSVSLTQTQISYIKPRDAPIGLSRSYSGPGPLSTAPFAASNFTDPVSGPTCSGSEIERTVTYTLENHALKDPLVRFILNTGAADQISLLEVDQGNVWISLNLDLDGDGVLETNFDDIPLSTLVAEPSNDFFTSTFFKNDDTGTPMSPRVLPTNGDYNSSWLMDPTLDYPGNNFPGESKLNAVISVPSLVDGTTPIVSGITLHLSRLLIGTPGVAPLFPFDQNQIDDFDNQMLLFPYGALTPTATPAYDDVFMEVHPGSQFSITYKGKHVPQENMDPSFDHFTEVVPINNVEGFQLVGFNTCPGTLLNRREFLRAGRAVSFGQLLSGNNQTSQLLMGNNDNDETTVDGQIGKVVFNMSETGILLPRVGNRTESSLRFDHACSQIEMIVEFEAGLGVPCPNNLEPRINMLGNCSNGTSFGFASAYYQGMSSASACGTSTDLPFEDLVEIEEIFRVESGNKTIFPIAIDIEPINQNDCISGGQRWIARFEMADFLDAPGGTNIIRTQDAQIHLRVKSYCPASEPLVGVTLKTYLYPQRCSGTAVVGPNLTSCTNGTCSQSQCADPTFNRTFLGSATTAVSVTCPGCTTPGWSIKPNVMVPLRHPDYVGYVDADNNGKPDLDASGNLQPVTDTTTIDLRTVRYGDVMTTDFSGVMFHGGASATRPGFTSTELSNNTLGPSLDLDKMVCDIKVNPGFRNFFQPIVQNGSNTAAIRDDISVAEYQNYESQYTSFLEFNFGGAAMPTKFPIDASHIAWVDDNTLRLAFTIDELYLADVSTTVNPDFFTNETVHFRIRYITDLDGGSRANTLGQRAFEFNQLLYSTDISMQSLLGTATSNPIEDLPDHAALLEDALSGQTWWCEAAVGKVLVAPHIESRSIFSQRQNNGADINRQNALQFPQISRTAEVGPHVVFQSGLKHTAPNKAANNVNYFEYEVRPTSLPTEMIFYIPKPYAPEAIAISNNVQSLIDQYDNLDASIVNGSNPSYLNAYIIDLKAPITHELPSIPSGMPLSLGFGIEIEEGIFMDPAYYPTDASSNQVFDATQAVEHYRVRVPLSFFYEASQYNALHTGANSFQVVGGPPGKKFRRYINANTDPSVLQLPNAVPLALGDEYQAMSGYVIYSMPKCTPGPNGYDEDCGFMNEHENFLYYFGDYERMQRTSTSSINTTTTFATYHPSNPVRSDAGQNDYLNSPRIHSIETTPLLCPEQVLTTPMVTPNPGIAMLSTLVNGVNNFPVAPGSLYEGAVPAALIPSNGFGAQGTSQNVLNFYYTQHSDIDASQALNVQFDPNTSEFYFRFRLSDQVLQQLRPQAGPCSIVDGSTYSTVNDFLQQSGAAGNGSMLRHIKGGIIPDVPEIDLSNLYFYLAPTTDANNPNALLLDLEKDLVITDITWTGYQAQVVGDFGNAGVAPGLAGDPRLFYLGDLPAANKRSAGVAKTVTVRGKFTCDDPSTLAKINQPNNNGIAFPFNVIVNYSTVTDRASVAVPNTLNTLGKAELTFQEAGQTMCSNNDTVPGFVLNVPQVFMETSLQVSGGDICNPEGTVTVINSGGSTLELLRIVLDGLPDGMLASPWAYDATSMKYTYSLVNVPGTLGTLLTSTASIDVPLSFANTTCQELGAVYSISTTVEAKTYCSNCQNSSAASNCLISETANDVLELGNVHFRDFSDYQAFLSPCATLESGGSVKINWNTHLNGTDLRDVNSYGPSDLYTFHFEIGGTSLTSTLSANPTHISNFFNNSYTIDPLDIARLCAGDELNITLKSVVVSSGCGVLSCDTTHVFNVSCLIDHPAMVLSTSAIDPSCFGLADGAATVSASGMAPFSYNWSNGQQGATATGLSSGTYSVTVTDGLGCAQTNIITLIDPNKIVVQLDYPLDADFCKDGFITLNASGANHYLWTHNSSTGSSLQITGPGTYTVVGSDVPNGTCTSTASIKLPAELFECCPDFIDFSSYSAFENPCATLLPDGKIRINWNETLGSLDLTQSGSYGMDEDYTFTFYVEGQLFTSVLNAGTANTFFDRVYQLNNSVVHDLCTERSLDIWLESIIATYVVDELECKTEFKFESERCVFTGRAITSEYKSTNVSCKGQADGTARVSVNGGLAPYSYVWSPSPGSGQGTASVSGLSQGTYEVLITDAFGCEVKQTLVIGAEDLPEIKISSSGDFCLDGFIILTVSGANFYSWSTGSSAASIQVNEPGTYAVYGSFYENSKCQSKTTITLNEDLFDCCPAVLDPQYHRVSGSITVDTYWPHKVILTSDIYVQKGAKLDVTNSDVITNYNGQQFGIYVLQGQLEATNSTFRPCDVNEKWLGIRVSDKGEAHLSECVVINAIVGVEATATGTAYLSNNQFLNNETGASYLGNEEGKASKHTFTGNTVTIDDRTPFSDDFYGIRLSNGIQLEGQVAQNDFVLASTGSKLYSKQFYAVYLRNAQATISHNTFTNVRSPYFQTDCNTGICTFENNKIDYNQTYMSLTGTYTGVTLQKSRARTTISGNLMLNALGGSDRTLGIYSSATDNVLIEGNTIEDFFFGINVSNGENINLVENTIDNPVWGINCRGNNYVQVLDNHLTDVRLVGIQVGSRSAHDQVAINNNYVEAIYGLRNFGVLYGNGSNYVTTDIELLNNCVRDAQYAMWLATSQKCASIPKVVGNSLFNYTSVGIHVDGYEGNIGSCGNGEPGRNSFVSEQASALDVRYWTDKGCKLVLEGNYPVSSALVFGSIPANRVFATNSCGIFGSSSECGQGGGFVPTEVYRNSIRKNNSILLSSNRLEIAPEFVSNLESIASERRLDYVLRMMSGLSANESVEPSEQLLGMVQGSLKAYFTSSERAWISYYFHLGTGNLAMAEAVLNSIDEEDGDMQVLKEYESIKMNILMTDSISDDGLKRLEQIENHNSEVGAMARALLNESTAAHPFIYLTEELILADIEGEGLEENSPVVSDFQVFPNPTKGSIDISYRLNSSFTTGFIEVRNVHGQLIERIQLAYEVATEQLDLSQFAAGLYHVSLIKDGTLIHATTVVKD